MKRIFSSIVFASLALSTFAGGLLTNTNQHSAFVRNPARYASLETDAIYFNPAGTAFFGDGWRLSANWQMVWQSRDVSSALTNKAYEGKVYVPCMPTVLASYTKGDWSFSGFFGIPGGGGNAQFNDGLPAFDAMGAGLVASSGLSAKSAFESTQYVFSLQLGAAYRISDNWSVYAGIRGNYTTANYAGAITAVHPLAGDYAKILELDLTQKGFAFAPVVGVDYKVGDFNFAAKYEFRAVTTVENETEKFSSELLGAQLGDPNLDGKIGMLAQMLGNPTLGALATLENGKTLRSDAPALLSLSGSWQATSWFKAMIGGVYYFDKDAKVESLLGGADNNINLEHNTYELLAGVEFNVTKNLLLSAGIQFSDFGVTDKYTSDLGFVNDSFMTGLGAKYSFNKNWDLNLGFCYANYAHDTNKLNGSSYLRKTYNATIGVDFKF